MADLQTAGERERHVDRDGQPQERGFTPGQPRGREGGEHEQADQGERGLEGKGDQEIRREAAVRKPAEQERGPRLGVLHHEQEAADVVLGQQPAVGRPHRRGTRQADRGLDQERASGLAHCGIGRERAAKAVGSPEHHERDHAHGHEQDGHMKHPRGGALDHPLAARPGRGHRRAPERDHRPQTGQDGQENRGRELRREGRPQGEAGAQQPQGGGPRGEAVERDHGQEEEQGQAEVRGHDLSVGEHVGREHAQQQGQRGRRRAEAAP